LKKEGEEIKKKKKDTEEEEQIEKVTKGGVAVHGI